MWQKMWQSLINVMSTSSELQVWHTVGHGGHGCWHAYHPVTRRSQSFGTEAEMRMWIEQQYYINQQDKLCD